MRSIIAAIFVQVQMHGVEARTSERIFRALILLVFDAIREGELIIIIPALVSTFCWRKTNDVGVSNI